MHNETFYTDKEIQETKLALISDLHYYYPNYNINILLKIIKQIKKQKPDYICIAGDIVDDVAIKDFSELENFFKELSRIAPIIVVLGNHDQKTGYMWNWSYKSNNGLKTILKHVKNLHILNDTNFKDKERNINFYGFNLSYKHFEELDESYNSFETEVKELKANLPDEPYNILLFHSPINIYKFINKHPKHNFNKANLILSGHMHNGCLPYWMSHFINKTFKTSRSIISPLRQPLPKHSQGRIYNEKVDGYIYQGISKLSHSTRWLHIFDKIYKINVQFITIKNKD